MSSWGGRGLLYLWVPSWVGEERVASLSSGLSGAGALIRGLCPGPALEREGGMVALVLPCCEGASTTIPAGAGAGLPDWRQEHAAGSVVQGCWEV